MGFEALVQQAFGDLQQAGGLTVTYRRGALAAEVTAVPVDNAELLERSAAGVSVEVARRDWLVQADALSQFGEPEPGDLVEQVVGQQTYRYEVLPLVSETHYRRVGPTGEVLRIYSQLVGVS